MVRFILALLVGMGLSSPVVLWAADYNFASHKDIPYAQKHELQALDIYAPEGAKNAPVVIYVHGGAWRIGDKKQSRKHGRFYAKKGIVFVSVNYRMLPDNPHPAQVSDVASAIAWVKNNIHSYGGSSANMVLVGHSAGAHLVALVGVDLHYLQAFDLKPSILREIFPIDSAAFDLTLTRTGAGKKLMKRIVRKNFGTSTKALQKASPMFYANHLTAKMVKDIPRFHPFVTALRPQAKEETERFGMLLDRAGVSAEVGIIQEFSHAEMNASIGSDGVISDAIIAALQ